MILETLRQSSNARTAGRFILSTQKQDLTFYICQRKTGSDIKQAKRGMPEKYVKTPPQTRPGKELPSNREILP